MVLVCLFIHDFNTSVKGKSGGSGKERQPLAPEVCGYKGEKSHYGSMVRQENKKVKGGRCDKTGHYRTYKSLSKYFFSVEGYIARVGR